MTIDNKVFSVLLTCKWYYDAALRDPDNSVAMFSGRL